MEIGLLEKMKIVFEVLFSSFMSIEIFLFFLLLFLLVLFNIKIKNKIIPFILTGFLLILIVFFCFYFSSYALICIDTFIMKLMDYYYFPSTVVFFFLFLFMVGVFIFTMFRKKLSMFSKILNYGCSILVFLFFAMFVSLAIVGGIDLSDTVALYENKQILTVVQVSNFIILFWILITFFYQLYLFFKRKYDID